MPAAVNGASANWVIDGLGDLMTKHPLVRICGLAAVVAAMSMLGACNASRGIVAHDKELTVARVTVTKTTDVDAGARFVHDLREELRHQASRVPPGGGTASLNVQVRELAYGESGGFGQPGNRMVSHGELVDMATGDHLGEFPVSVKVANADAQIDTRAGRRAIVDELIGLTAERAMDAIYGARRAEEYAANRARHARRPYQPVVARARRPAPRKKVEPEMIADPIPLPLPQDYLELPPGEGPLVIEAPELPV